MTQDIYKKIVLGGLTLGIVGGLIAFVAIFSFGAAQVSARPPHLPITTTALHSVFKASVARAAKSAPEPPALDDPGLIALGAQHYGQVCSSCHGGPGLGQSPVALSMRPRPQSLPAVVGQFEDKELYEILRNGVRFSAMPSWPADSNFNEIWAVVAFLRQLPDMSDETYVELTRVDQSTSEPGSFAWQTRGVSAELTLHAMAPRLRNTYTPPHPRVGGPLG